MPTISEFHGIVIRMFHADHRPPHLHATYGEFESIVDLDRVAIVAGRLPNRIERLVLEWTEIHRGELLANWDRCEQLQPLMEVEPMP